MNLLNFLFSSLLWLVIINVFVVAHFWIIEKRRQSPLHVLNAFFVGTLALFISKYSYDELTYKIVSFIYFLLVYWAIFPLQLNLFRKKPLLYLGDDSDPDEDSIMDVFERSFKNPGLSLGLKIVLAIMCSFILMDIQ